MVNLMSVRAPILAILLFCALAGSALSIPFEFRPLSPQRADRLTKEALKEYQLGLGALDKINYELGLDHFTKAVQAEPDNPWLRFCVTQVACYLGDTRKGADSIRYYDLAALNLKAITESQKLNAREQQRAQQWFETVTQLRQSVLERDAKRIQHGREIAKQYIKEIYHKDQAEQEKAAKEGRLKKEGAVAGTSGLPSQPLLPGEKRSLDSSYSEPETRAPAPSEQPLNLRKEPQVHSGEKRDLKAPTPETH